MPWSRSATSIAPTPLKSISQNDTAIASKRFRKRYSLSRIASSLARCSVTSRPVSTISCGPSSSPSRTDHRTSIRRSRPCLSRRITSPVQVPAASSSASICGKRSAGSQGSSSAKGRPIASGRVQPYCASAAAFHCRMVPSSARTMMLSWTRSRIPGPPVMLRTRGRGSRAGPASRTACAAGRARRPCGRPPSISFRPWP